jgi:hypothetical protein
MSIEALREALQPVLSALGDLPLQDPTAAARTLQRRLPLSGPDLSAVRSLMETGEQQGWLLPREAGGVRFGRVAKDLSGFSVDAVEMSGPGPRHRHPAGEIDLLFATGGEPEFCGHPEGWAVFAPDSVHVPEVRNGTMLILYFLPAGAIEFLP